MNYFYFILIFPTCLCFGCYCSNSPEVSYDYSSPTSSFISLQSAIRNKDENGIKVHYLEPIKFWRLKQGLSVDNQSVGVGDGEMYDTIEDLDRMPGGNLRLSKAKIIQIEGEMRLEGDAIGVNSSLGWPSGERCDEFIIISLDKGKSWWCMGPFFTGVHPEISPSVEANKILKDSGGSVPVLENAVKDPSK